MYDRKRFAETLAWAASSENPDEEVRAWSKELLDMLCFFNRAIAPRGWKPKAQRIECLPDLQAARADSDLGVNGQQSRATALPKNLLKLCTVCTFTADR